MKILVADDDTLNRKYLRALLAHEGHTVIECEDGWPPSPAWNKILATRLSPTF